MFDTSRTHADVVACNRALDELLGAIVAYDCDHAAQKRRLALVDLVRKEDGKPDLARARFRALVADPVRRPMCDGLKRLGTEIHRLAGGTGGMMDSYDQVCGLDSDHAGRRAAILNSAWNGVGSGDDRWWS